MRQNLRSYCAAALLGIAAIGSVQGASAEANLSKKWFPGHYIYADEKTFSLGLRDRSRELIRNNSDFTGYHVRYSWAVLEPTKGNYDFSLIARDLNTARADGKKLIVGIWDRNSQDTVRVPVPKYLTTDPIYEGGVYVGYAAAADTEKLMPKHWVPAVAERRAALFRALGKAFDSNQTLAYIGVPETAVTNSKEQPGFSSAKLRDGYIAVYNAAAEALPNTIFGQFTNWLGGLEKADADRMMAHLVETTKNGFGGPDALEATRPFDGTSSLGALDNAFGVYYKKYRGVAPITSSSQAPTYKANDALTVLNYAVNQLGAHFMTWAPIEDGGKWTIFDVIKMLEQQNGRINVAPPSNVTGSLGTTPLLPPPDGVQLQTN